MLLSKINSTLSCDSELRRAVCPCFYSPQHAVHPNNVAFMRGFVVDRDGGCGLDPQVASPPLKPTVVSGHHLTFPQH